MDITEFRTGNKFVIIRDSLRYQGGCLISSQQSHMSLFTISPELRLRWIVAYSEYTENGAEVFCIVLYRKLGGYIPG